MDGKGRRAAILELTILTENQHRQCVMLGALLIDAITDEFKAFSMGGATAFAGISVP
jgi:hypothetical protein